MDLNGKAALVLGGIKGIGKAVALALAEAGASVAATYFDWEEELHSLERDLAAARPGAPHSQDGPAADGRRPAAWSKPWSHRFGRLDILVNNIERGGWPVVHGAYVREQWDLEHGDHPARQALGVRRRPAPPQGRRGRGRGQPVLDRRPGRPVGACSAGVQRRLRRREPGGVARSRKPGRARARPRCA